MNREVTIQDFIMPEFRGADPKDYEFRDDGKIVRKDRWERGIYSIYRKLVHAELLPNRDFEISELVTVVENLIIHYEKSLKEEECEND